MEYFFEGTVDPILAERRDEKEKTLDFDYVIRARKKIIQKNFQTDKKQISQKNELCLNWQTRSINELERKKTIDLAVGAVSRYTDDLANKPGWTIPEGTSNYQGINDLCEDLGCWDPNKKKKYEHSVVSHELTIYNDSKDPKPQIRELQKEVGFLTRDLNMCTDNLNVCTNDLNSCTKHVQSQNQNQKSYGLSTPLSPQLQRPSQPWEHSYHPSGEKWDYPGVPLPVMQEDGSLFNKPIYETAMDVLTWPGNILDKTHPHWKQKPPPGPIRGLLAIMGNGLITIACLILLMMIMFIMGHLVVSIFSVSSTSLQNIKDAVLPKRNDLDQELSSEKAHQKVRKKRTLMQKVFGIFQAKEKKIVENEGSLIYFLKKWWDTSAERKEEFDQNRFFAKNRINRGGARFEKELDQSLLLLDPIFLIIHMFKLHKILVLHQERKPVAEVILSIGKSIKEIKKSVQLYSLYFGLAMGTIMTPISTTHYRNSPSYLVIDARERAIGISETSSHIEKIQLGDKILVLGSKRTPVLKKEALESLEYLNIPKNSKFGVSRTKTKTKTKRLKAKMRRFSDLPKLGEFNDSQDLQILLPQTTSSRLRIRTK
jgi:hypothetical protein